ncbi:low temperature requirement protein A [Plantactinospora siamensis]|uniref:Low temperature requirement protein A n=1 Tax=Plantactinospora siamensis TaxID=555372 RepID=A0ABV6NW34_9ACTN
MGRIGASGLINWGGPGTRVTRLELFYDLIFVFAFLNVTSVTGSNLRMRGLLEALLVLALLWWCWTGFVTIGNSVRADSGVMPIIGFCLVAAIFVLALSAAGAFHDIPGGLYGPWLFAVAYLITWLLKTATMWTVAMLEHTPVLPTLLLIGPALISAAIVLLAAAVPQRVAPEGVAQNVRLGLWVIALLFEYLGGLLVGRTGWYLRSAGHAAERHALIVLVALGESVIALGVGASARPGQPLTLPIVFAAVLGVGVIAGLWWLYFDWIPLAVEQKLHGIRGPERLPVARDIYSYLHLPLVVGIILFALGLNQVLAVVSPARGGADGALGPATLYGGVSLFLLALAAIELRGLRRLDRVLLAAAVLVVALIPAAYRLSALAALALLAGVVVAVVLVQLWATWTLRGTVRAVAVDEQTAMEAEANRWRAQHL